MNSFQNYTPHRCYANAAGEENGRNARIVVECEGSARTLHFELRTERHCFQYALKRRVTHAGCHHQIVFIRSARQRKSTCIAFGVGFRWIDQGEVNPLPAL